MKKRTILDQFLRDNRPLWQRWVMVVVGFLLLLLAPALAHAQGGGTDTLQLVWTAPGDDGYVGTATAYELRMSTSPITVGNWISANVVGPPPSPLVAGTRQGCTVRGLSTDTTYYFAIRTLDEVGNCAALSNVLRWDWAADAAPPAAPIGVFAARIGADVRVTWSPGTESDLDGYAVYRATSAGGPFVRVNATLATPPEYLDTAVPAGTLAVWYRVSASDLSGNESSQSAPAQVQLVAAPSDWTVSPAYPNPSGMTQSVCIPIVIPASGAGDATVEIVNAGGQRVRLIRIQTAATCAGGGGVTWDGTNESGRLVAPGPYRVKVVAGDTFKSTKLVRVP